MGKITWCVEIRWSVGKGCKVWGRTAGGVHRGQVLGMMGATDKLRVIYYDAR